MSRLTTPLLLGGMAAVVVVPLAVRRLAPPAQAPAGGPAGDDRPPHRIVSLAPSITEMLCSLGLADRVVGRTQYCTYPPQVQHARVVGALNDISLEAVAELEPDLVLITRNSRLLADKLAPLGLPVRQVPADSLEDIYSALDLIGRWTGRAETAHQVIARLKDDLAGLAGSVRPDRPRRVLIVTGPMSVPARPIWVAGPGTFLDRLVALAGHRNVLPSSARPWGELSLEQFVEADPELILESRPGDDGTAPADVYAAWAGVGPVQAIRERGIRSVRDIALLHPGPRVNQALYEVIRALNGPPAKGLQRPRDCVVDPLAEAEPGPRSAEPNNVPRNGAAGVCPREGRTSNTGLPGT